MVSSINQDPNRLNRADPFQSLLTTKLGRNEDGLILNAE